MEQAIIDRLLSISRKAIEALTQGNYELVKEFMDAEKQAQSFIASEATEKQVKATYTRKDKETFKQDEPEDDLPF
jgi:hypothetical protein